MIVFFLRKRYNIRVYKIEQLIMPMKITSKIKDLEAGLIKVYKEDLIEDIEDNIIKISCKICSFQKEFPTDQCLLCGSILCDMTIP